MNNALKSETFLKELSIPLERDVFLRTLIRELAGTLQDVVGLEEASGFISVVGQNMGRQIDHLGSHSFNQRRNPSSVMKGGIY